MLHQTPWFDRTFDLHFPLTNFPVIFSRLEGSLFRLGVILANADDERLLHFLVILRMNERVLEKLSILADAAKYDVSCSSSGSKRKNENKGLGNAEGWVSAMLIPKMAAVFRC
jgi:hypothetical protein